MASVMGESCGSVVQKSGIVKTRWVSPLLFEHQMAEQRRLFDQTWGGKAKTLQRILDRTSVFHSENNGFWCLSVQLASEDGVI